MYTKIWTKFQWTCQIKIANYPRDDRCRTSYKTKRLSILSQSCSLPCSTIFSDMESSWHVKVAAKHDANLLRGMQYSVERGIGEMTCLGNQGSNQCRWEGSGSNLITFLRNHAPRVKNYAFIRPGKRGDLKISMFAHQSSLESLQKWKNSRLNPRVTWEPS